MRIDWLILYFETRRGILVDDEGAPAIFAEDGRTPLRFSSAAAAEQWLKDSDERATIKDIITEAC